MISVVIPVYNAESHISRCIDTVLAQSFSDLEIIIVDDGSKDRTAEIADRFAAEYPTRVKAIHQENGGHGEAVNTGLAYATGQYFKVVDSDDWVNEKAYAEILSFLETVVSEDRELDMLISNFVYEKEGVKRKKVMKYTRAIPEKQFLTWDEIHGFTRGHYILMHSVIYRTQMLKDCGLKLPAHTFYVDNIFVYQPLPHVKTMYYLDVNFYRYFIGREDQSVNERVLMSRIDQQLKVTDIVSGCVNLDEVKEEYPKLAQYMCRNISIMMAISSIHLLLINTKEAYGKRREMWERVKGRDKSLYYKLKYTTLSGLTYLPGKLGGALTIRGYRAARKIYQFQ